MNNKDNYPDPNDISLDRVKSYMMWLIGKYGDYSEKKLMQKANLLFKADTQYNQPALDYLIERGIVNDLRYAERLTQRLSDGNIGPNKIKEKLYVKGFRPEVINESLATLEQDDEDYFNKALVVKIRKFGEQPIDDIKLKQKALRHLISKGFSYTIANKAICFKPE